MRITIPHPQDQPPFRPIHFAAKLPNGEVHIFVWKSLDDAVHIIKTLVPNLRPFLTAEHVRGLAAPEWDDIYVDLLSLDEFAALWFAQVAYTPEVVIPYKLEDLYDANGAAVHAKRLMEPERQNRFESYHSEWQLFVQKLVLLTPSPTVPQHPVARQELMIDANPCKDCEVPPVGLIFPHAAPNWVIYCPCCEMGTDPREGWNRATTLEAWNKWN